MKGFNLAKGLAAIAAALAIGSTFFYLLGEPISARNAPTEPGRTQDIEELRQELASGRAARAVLEEKVGRLEDALLAVGIAIDANAGATPPRALEPATDSDTDRGEEEAALASPTDALEPGDVGTSAAARPAAFDTVGLATAGYSEYEADRLRESWEGHALAKLYLNDRAARQGWRLKPRHRRELRDLEQAFREEIGEETYDAILFATGQTNRVVVRDVLAGSPADGAGFQPGDVILRYDDERIFLRRELNYATSGGRSGQTTRVEVIRDGEVLSLYVQRGPLGILTDAGRSPPSRR
ncbi:MAG: PDZ domain-containing protein [Proteobacteria bacterium]|nr:PDZ domain-containing protein [Pseudomonadota bacterium]